MREWPSPANASTQQIGWHVFDIDGTTGIVTSVDTVTDSYLPRSAHDPYTDVCP